MPAAGLAAARQFSGKVYYNDAVVGEFFPDLLVEDVLPRLDIKGVAYEL